MDLHTLVVRDVEDRFGSLTLALEALLRWAGAEVRYRDLNAALALSLRTTAVRGQSCLGGWSTHGADAFVVPAARLYGIRLRDLHPPQAAAGLADHHPFAQHFDASYAPLIRRALEHGQPVIAWQGWPDVRASLWGVINRMWPDGVGFAGTTMWSHGQVVPLVAPPVQFYVVEEITPREPTDPELWRLAMRGFQQAARGRMETAADVVTGDAAYDRWLNLLQTGEICPTCGQRGGRCHLQHARFLVADRASSIRFFQHYRDGADPGLQPSFDALAANCRGPIDALTTSCDCEAVEQLVKTPQGREALTVGVQAARVFDRAAAAAIERLAELTA